MSGSIAPSNFWENSEFLCCWSQSPCFGAFASSHPSPSQKMSSACPKPCS